MYSLHFLSSHSQSYSLCLFTTNVLEKFYYSEFFTLAENPIHYILSLQTNWKNFTIQSSFLWLRIWFTTSIHYKPTGKTFLCKFSPVHYTYSLHSKSYSLHLFTPNILEKPYYSEFLPLAENPIYLIYVYSLQTNWKKSHFIIKVQSYSLHIFTTFSFLFLQIAFTTSIHYKPNGDVCPCSE